MQFEPVIGLEVHAQLLTRSKIFCSCSTAFGAPPNTNVCPVCLGLPGALPVLNREAVAMGVRASLALGCRINRTSLFARKNYFYPDLPKGYQISQFDLPVAQDGQVSVLTGEKRESRSFRINRLHLEDDAGKSIHGDSGGTQVNLNRTGVPLAEIVTEADFRSSEEAYDFVHYLRKVLLYLGVCDGNMEEGSLRCDANVSIRPVGQTEFGTKTEIKNLNSFRFLRKALDFEISRQIEVVCSGGRIHQETRLWDEEAQMTFPMRSKEEAHDYRYFPEPDLLPVVIGDEWYESLESSLPELPEPRRQRFIQEYGLDPDAALALTQSRAFADYFEAAVAEYRAPEAICNWMVGDLTRDLKKENREIENSPVSPQHLAQLIQLLDKGTISGKIAKTIFPKMFETGAKPADIVAEAGLKQISNVDELASIADRILAANPDKVSAYRDGKEGLIGFFVGQVMRETKGQANPQLVNELLTKKLQGIE